LDTLDLCNNCKRPEEAHRSEDVACPITTDKDGVIYSNWLTYEEEPQMYSGVIPPITFGEWIQTLDEDGQAIEEYGTIPECPEPIPAHTDPAHYTAGRQYETWDVIADWDLDFLLGNVVKYVSRAGRKNGDNSKLSDLIKAANYINKAIEKEKNNG